MCIDRIPGKRLSLSKLPYVNACAPFVPIVKPQDVCSSVANNDGDRIC